MGWFIILYHFESTIQKYIIISIVGKYQIIENLATKVYIVKNVVEVGPSVKTFDGGFL